MVDHPHSFTTIFQTEPLLQVAAPGRVNLLGEHTDYSEGWVMPTAIPQQTIVQLGLSQSNCHHFYSQTTAEEVWLHPGDQVLEGFGRYLWGCLQVLAAGGIEIPFLNVHVTSSIPIGAGLSSSAALEIAMLRGLRSLLSLPLSDLELAKLGQQAERNYVGVQCGILDQMAVTFADLEHLLFLDTHTLAYRSIPLPVGSEVLVLDSGIPRTLATSGYNQRRAECETAAQLLALPSLRDLTNADQLTTLPEPLYQRARHVFTENQRVLIAAKGASAPEFGTLMNASHASLRDDFQVSVTGLDRLVEQLQATTGVYGAKLTGAGFGGACVALVEKGQGRAIGALVLEHYHRAGYHGVMLVPEQA
jgi:galactokinase